MSPAMTLPERDSLLAIAAPIVRRLAGWYTRRSHAERDDLTQEGWVAVLLALRCPTPPRTPEHWAAHIQKHVWGRMWRFAKSRGLIRPPWNMPNAVVASDVPTTRSLTMGGDVPGHEPDPCEAAIRHEDQSRVRAALDHLPALDAILLRRTYGIGQPLETHQRIARDLNYCVNHVRTLRARALHDLQDALIR